ncbi:MAG: hypothetical protein H6727_10570 [Myxococcales bacterium]|nr:hypothetical protein [Myxococcales bacterium]
MSKTQFYKHLGTLCITVFCIVLFLADSEDFTKVNQTICSKQQSISLQYTYVTNCPGASATSSGTITLNLPETLDIGMTEGNARLLGTQAQAGGLLTTRWFLKWHNVCRSRVPTVPDGGTTPDLDADGGIIDGGTTDAGTVDAATTDASTEPIIYMDNGIPLAFLTRSSVPSRASLERIQLLFVDKKNTSSELIQEISCGAEIPLYKSDVIDGTMMKKELRLTCEIYHSAPLAQCPKTQPNCDGTRLPNATCDLVLNGSSISVEATKE